MHLCYAFYIFLLWYIFKTRSYIKYNVLGISKFFLGFFDFLDLIKFFETSNFMSSKYFIWI